MYSLATIHIVTDRRMDKRTDRRNDIMMTTADPSVWQYDRLKSIHSMHYIMHFQLNHSLHSNRRLE